MSIKDEIQKLQHKSELIELSQKMIAAEILFQPSLIRKSSNEAISEITRTIKDFLTQFISNVERDINPTCTISLTAEDIEKLKLVADRLTSKPTATSGYIATLPASTASAIEPIIKTTTASTTHLMLQSLPPVKGRKAILLDSASAYDFQGPPSIDGINIKDRVIPDSEVIIMTIEGENAIVKQGMIQFRIPSDCLELI